MQAFDLTAATEYISSLLSQDQSDAIGMTGLLYLMESLDAVDESIVECWNGFCKFSDGACECFDRRRALQMFSAQHRAREACLTGNIPFAPSVTPVPLSQLVVSQQADISITQFWLLKRLWNLCLSHGLLRDSSDHAELRYDFACQIARILMANCNSIPLSAMEVHGIGLVEKVYDVAMDVVTAMHSSPGINLDMVLVQQDVDVFSTGSQLGVQSTVQELLYGFNSLLQNFRGGDHQYSSRFAAALSALGGSRLWSE